MTERLKWIVLSRASPDAEWTAYGPMKPGDALAWVKSKVGSGIECKVAILLPAERNELPVIAIAEPFDAQDKDSHAKGI